MARPFELLVGLRYTRAKRRNHFISFISLSSMIGIALGVTVLITVLSVMNGFGEELRARILGVVSHITISGERGQLANWEEVAKPHALCPVL
jgi:lipoprotein-releasing system permease protein